MCIHNPARERCPAELRLPHGPALLNKKGRVRLHGTEDYLKAAGGDLLTEVCGDFSAVYTFICLNNMEFYDVSWFRTKVNRSEVWLDTY